MIKKIVLQNHSYSTTFVSYFFVLTTFCFLSIDLLNVDFLSFNYLLRYLTALISSFNKFIYDLLSYKSNLFYLRI